MEPPQGDRDLSLPGMPTEILSLIINLVDSESLKTLRLTNKRLCAIASGPFALEYFSERKHVVSQHSMNALIEITAHSFFGKFVKTVTICGSRPRMFSGCSGPAPQHRVLSFRQLRDKLNEIFSNIRRNSSSVCVGACDEAGYCYGSEDFARCVDAIDSFNHNLFHAFYGQEHFHHMAKIFGITFRAAQAAGCEIERIKVDIPDTKMAEMLSVGYGEEVQTLLRTFITPLSKPLSLDLIRGNDHGEYLRYDHITGELRMLGVSLHTTTDDDCNYFPNVQSTLDWLTTFSITQIDVSHCFVTNSDLLRIFCVPQLERLTLRDIELHTGFFEFNFWSHFLLRLSRLTTLKYLELLWASYYFLSDRSHFVLPSGRYQFAKQTCSFRLLLSEDKTEAVVLSDHTSISGQLKALSDRVAQLELDKIAEIERDGYVRTNFVGISKTSQPEEDVVSGEDDHGSMEDDGSDEADNAGGEREENDDQDEHEHTVELSEI
ncbi:hypothetical protein KCU71_g11029, partial [Aureobasidium melanogenum]